ncbi:hypothetical protein NEOLEDRAFT_1146347 [Neolentinus lepideus HHB14362 ss-1]|uniref:Uncharacterized protein n=1 Tax=Neolentinus lepideus HHB14362 ss-1 TaxID=1314782 RepID=A0A165U1B6_9AGAM|nr:hypothetical protein NEOLEDRAFT_1146347 [Neolentinus lepideus HHB14362 ss-1]
MPEESKEPAHVEEESDEYDDIGEEEEEGEEVGGFEDDNEDVDDGDAEGEYEPQQRQASLTALLLSAENGAHPEGDDEDVDDEYDDEEDDVEKEEYVPADGKVPPTVAGPATSTAVKRSRGELDEDKGPGVVGSGNGVGDEGFDEEESNEEEEEQGAKRVKV